MQYMYNTTDLCVVKLDSDRNTLFVVKHLTVDLKSRYCTIEEFISDKNSVHLISRQPAITNIQSKSTSSVSTPNRYDY